MSTIDQWAFTVPEEEAELLAELRRHGVRPGARVRVSLLSEEAGEGLNETSRGRLSFAGSISAEPDLSDRVDKYLKGFGEA
jgi:hypothetical protein